MEVKHLNEGAWLEADTEEAGPVKLKIRYISYHEAVLFRKLKDEEASLENIENLIIDWNLTDGGKRVKCDHDNKVRYVPYLLGMTLKAGKGETEQSLGQAIVRFAIDTRNFTKN